MKRKKKKHTVFSDAMALRIFRPTRKYTKQNKLYLTLRMDLVSLRILFWAVLKRTRYCQFATK